MLPSPPLTPQLPGLQRRDWADGGAPGWRRSLSVPGGGRVWRSLHLIPHSSFVLPVPRWSLSSPSFRLLLPTLPSVVCLDVTVAAAQTGYPRSVPRRARLNPKVREYPAVSEYLSCSRLLRDALFL